MPIPDFQTLMRPLLELHQDGEEHVNRDLVNELAEQFSLTEGIYSAHFATTSHIRHHPFS